MQSSQDHNIVLPVAEERVSRETSAKSISNKYTIEKTTHRNVHPINEVTIKRKIVYTPSWRWLFETKSPILPQSDTPLKLLILH